MKEMVPVVLFVYNRLDKTKKCLEALEQNQECSQTDIYIYADGAKNSAVVDKVKEVRDFFKENYIKNSHFKSVTLIESEQNKGLANSIIGGVTEVINKYGKVIVVEDDLIVTSDFLNYMNRALDFYENDSQIGSISAYTLPLKILKKYKHDVYILRKGDCWGWGTWKNRWETVDWTVGTYEEYKANPRLRKEFEQLGYGLDNMLCCQMEGNLDSWAVRWCYHLFRQNLWTVYPRISKTRNIGLDGTGEHCSITNMYDASIVEENSQCIFEKLPVNKKFEKATVDFEAGKRTIFETIMKYIKKCL